MGRARILPEAERTLALLMALGRGGSAMVVGIARIAPGPFLQLGPGASSLKNPATEAAMTAFAKSWRRE